MTLEEKVKKYEEDIAVMKEKVNSIVVLHVFIIPRDSGEGYSNSVRPSVRHTFLFTR